MRSVERKWLDQYKARLAIEFQGVVWGGHREAGQELRRFEQLDAAVVLFDQVDQLVVQIGGVVGEQFPSIGEDGGGAVGELDRQISSLIPMKHEGQHLLELVEASLLDQAVQVQIHATLIDDLQQVTRIVLRQFFR